MLRPETDRLDYGEQLNPPVGYELDSAIATTYSLDLNALLAVPVALCFNDTLDGDIKGEKLALLEAIGQLKGRLKVFYQKGNISYPRKFNRLYTLLEPCLQPIIPKNTYSSFHPKLWLLRFVESDFEKVNCKVCYRLIVLSRNLTFDRSWDVAISLDGVIDKHNSHSDVNEQWTGFIKGLLNQDESFAPAAMMKKELSQIVWQAPDKFSDVNLLIGGDKNGRPVNIEQKNNDELIVVSPFIKSTRGDINALQWLADFSPKGKRYLFSRAEELNAIGKEKLSDWECFAINEKVVNGEKCHEVNDTAAGEERRQQNLHAKMIIQKQGNQAFWHVGSANATTAALGDSSNKPPRNIETMVSMKGANSKVGPKQVMDEWMPEKGPQLFVKHDEFQEATPELNESSTQLLRETVHELINLEWKLEPRLDQESSLYTLTLSVNKTFEPPTFVTVEQLAIAGKHPLSSTMIWEKVELDKISAFIPVRVKIEADSDTVEKLIIIEAKLLWGKGKDTRHQDIMKSLVDTPEKVLNYLRLLLQVNPEKSQWLSIEDHTGKGNGDFFLSENPILEQLLVASSRHPQLLGRIDNSLKRLVAAGVDIPSKFSDLWKHFKKEVK